MKLEELKKSLLDNFNASWHSISRMQTRGIKKELMLKVIENGSVQYCMNNIIKFKNEDIIIVVSSLTAKIITVMIQGNKQGKPSKQRKNRIAKKKRRSWKEKL
jgi:hypothetical protein